MTAADTLSGVGETLQGDAAAQLQTFPPVAGARQRRWMKLFSVYPHQHQAVPSGGARLLILYSSRHAPPLLEALHGILLGRLLVNHPHRERAKVLGHLRR